MSPTLQPSRASSRASARPMPLDTPVMIATLLAKDMLAAPPGVIAPAVAIATTGLMGINTARTGESQGRGHNKSGSPACLLRSLLIMRRAFLLLLIALAVPAL